MTRDLTLRLVPVKNIRAHPVRAAIILVLALAQAACVFVGLVALDGMRAQLSLAERRLGADLVVGTQAHHPQTFEYYLEKPIYYGLGNLFFDQTYWPGTRRGLILTHYFKSGKLLNTRISPTWYDGTHQVFLMPEKEAESFLGRLVTAR